jgi:hypothetical protein
MTAMTEVLVTRHDRVSADHMRSLCDTATYTSHCSTGESCEILDFGGKNLKYRAPHLVTVDYRNVDRLYTPDDFPKPAVPVSGTTRCRHDVAHIASASPAALERARRYLASVPAAIAGQHGDLHTFRMCCRLVRGFALSDREALGILADWNARCVPPWTERELIEKLRRARKYGHEPFGRLLTRNG